MTVSDSKKQMVRYYRLMNQQLLILPAAYNKRYLALEDNRVYLNNHGFSNNESILVNQSISGLTRPANNTAYSVMDTTENSFKLYLDATGARPEDAIVLTSLYNTDDQITFSKDIATFTINNHGLATGDVLTKDWEISAGKVTSIDTATSKLNMATSASGALGLLIL